MRYSRETWSIELPKDWEVEETDECILVFHPEQLGAFQISSYFKDEDQTVEKKDLEEFAEIGGTQDVQLDHLKGITHTSQPDEDDFVMIQWWLAHGSELFYATYACDQEHMAEEAADRDKLINSLRPLDNLH